MNSGHKLSLNLITIDRISFRLTGNITALSDFYGSLVKDTLIIFAHLPQ